MDIWNTKIWLLSFWGKKKERESKIVYLLQFSSVKQLTVGFMPTSQCIIIDNDIFRTGLDATVELMNIFQWVYSTVEIIFKVVIRYPFYCSHTLQSPCSFICFCLLAVPTSQESKSHDSRDLASFIHSYLPSTWNHGWQITTAQ